MREEERGGEREKQKAHEEIKMRDKGGVGTEPIE